jgi:exonuclease SbcC
MMGSKVEVITKPTETVRSEQITEASSLREKVKIYAELSNDSVSDSILGKADALEVTARGEGIVSEGLHIRIKKLILRGAIGISKGVGKDQVEIDFEQYDPGLIALIGVNGSGKTTLIENMHPYPQMLTRSGKLQDHFCMRDSFRELYFTDDRAGAEYRAFMQIDGANKSGAVEYFLYRKENDTWIPFSEDINGRQEPYKQEILGLFGNIDLYLRSTFYTQKQPKGHPELNDATPGQKKEVFRELGGLQYLQTYAEYAKAEQKSVEVKLISSKASIETLEQLIGDLPGKREVLNNLQVRLHAEEETLSKVEADKNRLQEELEKVTERVERNKRLRQELGTLFTQIQEFEAEKSELESLIEQYQEALKSKDDLTQKLQSLEDLRKQKADLENEEKEVYKQREQLSIEYNDRKNAVADIEREITTKIVQTEKAFNEVKHQKDLLSGEANQLNNEFAENPLTENCPTCGQNWPAEKRTEFEQKRAKKQQKIEEFQQKIFEIDKEIVSRHKEVLKINSELEGIKEPEPPFLPEFDDARLKAVLQQLSTFDESSVRDSLQKAQEAGVRIEESEKRLQFLEEQLSEKMKKANDLEDQVDGECEAQHKEISEAANLAHDNYIETDKEITRIKTEISNVQKIIDSLEERREELETLKGSVKDKEKHLEEWLYLQKACGPDGIQALELDAMGPGIAEVANSILESAYGSRFQIEFRTTRIGGSGSKTKQIEDFLIIVHDSMDGSEQPFEWMSGGESVWIKRSIYDAFGIIRARKTGTKFLTVFQDESDGALDPEARTHYFSMLEKAHQEAGRYHTLVITHSIEAQEMIGQKLEMNELRAYERQEGKAAATVSR